MRKVERIRLEYKNYSKELIKVSIDKKLSCMIIDKNIILIILVGVRHDLSMQRAGDLR